MSAMETEVARRRNRAANDQYMGGVDIAMDAQIEGRFTDAQRVIAQARIGNADARIAVASGARAARAKRSLFHFFVQGWAVLEPDVELDINWHHKLVCDVLQGILMDWLRHQRTGKKFRQRVRNAIFNLPPGTTKSRIISVFAPAWMWLHRPSWTVLCLSANPDVATRDATLARDLVMSDWYRSTFGITWTIREDVNARGKYKNTAGGERTSRGLTSKVTGNRADAIFIDDPNDMHEVFSEASRKEVNSKFDNAIFNRVNDPRSSVRLLMQQRGHEDDLSGHWLAKDSSVLHVCLPMEFDVARAFKSIFGSDPRNDNGQLLHEARFTPEVIAAERERLGTFSFEAQYNQDAGSLDGGMFKREWFRFFTIAGRASQDFPRPNGCTDAPAFELKFKDAANANLHWTRRLDLDAIYVSVDATFGSVSDAASNVGLGAIGVKGAQLFVLDDRTEAMTYPQTKAAVRKMFEDYPAARKFLIEKKANGQAILDELSAEIPGMIAVEPEGGKIARAHAMSPRYEAHQVYVLEGAAWVAKHVDEISVFPNGKKDDRVDMMSQLVIHLMDTSSNASRWKAMAK